MTRIIVFAFLFCISFNLTAKTLDYQYDKIYCDTIIPNDGEDIVCEMWVYRTEVGRFPGCEDVEIMEERKQCSLEKMFDFIWEHFRYPDSNFCGKGMVVINFTIDKNGNIINPKIIRDIDGGIGEEVLRVVKLMPQWTPSIQRGKPIEIEFNLPVKFGLD